MLIEDHTQFMQSLSESEQAIERLYWQGDQIQTYLLNPEDVLQLHARSKQRKTTGFLTWGLNLTGRENVCFKSLHEFHVVTNHFLPSVQCVPYSNSDTDIFCSLR